MRVEIKLDEGATLPVSAHPSDTGYDLVAISDPIIVGESAGAFWRRIDYIEYDTGVSVAPPLRGVGYPDDKCMGGYSWTAMFDYLEVFPRSSVSKTNLVLANSIGLIDNAYRGTIKLRFRYLWQSEDLRQAPLSVERSKQFLTDINRGRIYQKGDKIGQLVARTKQEIEWKVVDTLSETSRGAAGFGSSDRYPDLHTDIAIKGGTPRV